MIELIAGIFHFVTCGLEMGREKNSKSRFYHFPYAPKSLETG